MEHHDNLLRSVACGIDSHLSMERRTTSCRLTPKAGAALRRNKPAVQGVAGEEDSWLFTLNGARYRRCRRQHAVLHPRRCRATVTEHGSGPGCAAPTGGCRWACGTRWPDPDVRGDEQDLVVTIEGLSPNSSHPPQSALVALEVPQCGYCQSGQIMKAAELLATTPSQTARRSRSRVWTSHRPLRQVHHRIIAVVEQASREG